MMLGYRPFLDPLPLDSVWYLLLVPLSLGVAMVYKAVRATDMSRYWRQVVIMSGQTVLAMVGLGVGFYVLVELILPRVAP
jgi:hypothetical protein